jgi:hypothetical protein
MGTTLNWIYPNIVNFEENNMILIVWDQNTHAQPDDWLIGDRYSKLNNIFYLQKT